MGIKKMAEKINKATDEQNAAISEIVAQVNDGLLTREEGARCMAGRALKIKEAHDLPGSPDHKFFLLRIDQEIDGELGLKLGRHI